MQSRRLPPNTRSSSTTGESAAAPADEWKIELDELPRHGKALLDHLNVDTAWIMGGCMGCSVALAFGAHYPEATRGLLLHWPVGGYRWKVNCQERFMRHYNFAKQKRLARRGRPSARR